MLVVASPGSWNPCGGNAPWCWHFRGAASRLPPKLPDSWAPLDVIVVRKLGVPFQPELGFGAIGEGGIRLLDRDLIHRAHLTGQDVAEVGGKERRELDRRVRPYRGSGCRWTSSVGRW